MEEWETIRTRAFSPSSPLNITIPIFQRSHDQIAQKRAMEEGRGYPFVKASTIPLRYPMLRLAIVCGSCSKWKTSTER